MCFLFGRRRNNVFLSQLLWENTLLLFYSPHIPVLHPIISDFPPQKTIKACQKTQLFNRKHHPLPSPLGGGLFAGASRHGAADLPSAPFCRSWRNEKPKAGRRRTLKIQMQAGKGQIFWTVFWWV